MKSITFILLLFSAPAVLLACSCTGSESFCRGIVSEHPVVMVKVGEEVSPGVYEFPVIENLLNHVGTDTIRLQSHTGWNCNVSLSQFTPNDTMIFKLWPSVLAGGGGNFDYALTFCGINYLYYSGGVVSGQVDFSVSELPFQDFRNMVMNMDCADRPEEKEGAGRSVAFPNPARNAITVESEEEIQDIEFFDRTGKSFIPPFEKLDKSTIRVDLSSLPVGVFFVKLYGLKTEKTIRLLKI